MKVVRAAHPPPGHSADRPSKGLGCAVAGDMENAPEPKTHPGATAMPETDPLVTTDWLEAHLHDPDLRVVDMRGYVITRPAGPGSEEATYRGAREEYLAGHVPGAVYVDWTA